MAGANGGAGNCGPSFCVGGSVPPPGLGAPKLSRCCIFFWLSRFCSFSIMEKLQKQKLLLEQDNQKKMQHLDSLGAHTTLVEAHSHQHRSWTHNCLHHRWHQPRLRLEYGPAPVTVIIVAVWNCRKIQKLLFCFCYVFLHYCRGPMCARVRFPNARALC